MQVCGQDSISGCVRTIQRAAGAGGLARGSALTVAREVPAFGIYFGSYEVMIRNFGESTGSILQAGGWGAAQQYRGTAHCLRASLAAEGAACLVRGIGSTVVRAFPMNAVTFGVYSYVMKRYGDTGAAAADTRDTWMADTREKISAYQRVSTLATDGPSIICVQEP